MLDFDALRTATPLTGWAVYAFDPGGPLTVEVLLPDGRMLTYEGATLAHCIDVLSAQLGVRLPDPPPDIEPLPSIFD
jgi:hypothetical protein